jgi:hypothetical protein
MGAKKVEADRQGCPPPVVVVLSANAVVRADILLSLARRTQGS